MSDKSNRDDFAAAWVAAQARILKMLRGVCRSPKKAEELFQRVFVDIFSGQRSWVPGTDVLNYARWVAKSILSHDRQSWENRHIQAEDDEDAPTSKPDPLQRIINAEVYDEIHDELPKGFVRTVFLQSLEGNDAPRDVAGALNVPEERVYEARKTIKKVTARVLARHGIAMPGHKLEDPS